MPDESFFLRCECPSFRQCGSDRLRTSRFEAESQGSTPHQRREALYEQRQRIGIEPNLVQPLPLTPFVVFREAVLTLSLSYLLGTCTCSFSSFPSHSPVPYLVSESPRRFFARFIVTHAHSHPEKEIWSGIHTRLTT